MPVLDEQQNRVAIVSVHASLARQVEVAELRADPEAERVAYFVVTAAVGNSVKYAGPGPSGHGLTLIAERVATVGGDLRITSLAGAGTVIRVALPRRL